MPSASWQAVCSAWMIALVGLGLTPQWLADLAGAQIERAHHPEAETCNATECMGESREAGGSSQASSEMGVNLTGKGRDRRARREPSVRRQSNGTRADAGAGQSPASGSNTTTTTTSTPPGTSFAEYVHNHTGWDVKVNLSAVGGPRYNETARSAVRGHPHFFSMP